MKLSPPWSGWNAHSLSMYKVDCKKTTTWIASVNIIGNKNNTDIDMHIKEVGVQEKSEPMNYKHSISSIFIEVCLYPIMSKSPLSISVFKFNVLLHCTVHWIFWELNSEYVHSTTPLFHLHPPICVWFVYLLDPDVLKRLLCLEMDVAIVNFFRLLTSSAIDNGLRF